MLRLYRKIYSILTRLLFKQIITWARNEYKKRTYITETGKRLPYRILYPKNYDSTRKYPLVLLLHGAGERGADNAMQLRFGSRLFLKKNNRKNFPAIVIFPQCPTNSYWASVKFDVSQFPFLIDFTYDNPLKWPMQAVMDLMQQFKNDGLVDENRLYVLGISMGGIGAFEIVSRYPDWFAAAVTMCGGGNPDYAVKYAKTTRLWVFHGEVDGLINVNYSRQVVARLKVLNADVRYTEYAGVEHGIWKRAMAEPGLMEWLFRQKKSF